MSPFFISGKKIKAICVNCKVLRKTFYYVVVVNRVLLQNLLLSDQPTSIRHLLPHLLLHETKVFGHVFLVLSVVLLAEPEYAVAQAKYVLEGGVPRI